MPPQWLHNLRSSNRLLGKPRKRGRQRHFQMPRSLRPKPRRRREPTCIPRIGQDRIFAGGHKSLGIEYCAANPGSTFRALHESMIK
jgi:hypothetical protein